MHKASAVVERERPDDVLATRVALACCVFSLSFLVAGFTLLYRHSDQRIVLTTLDVFHDWAGLQAVFRGATRYAPSLNPPSLDQVRFDTTPNSLSVFRDLNSRGLMSDADFANVTALFNQTTGLRLDTLAMSPADMIAQLMAMTGASLASVSAVLNHTDFAQLVAQGSGASLLSHLLSIAGCTFPDAIPGTTPITRSKGCRCIGDAYLDFVRAAVNTTQNVSAAVREAGASSVLRCVDRRVTWHSWGGGEWWSVHPLGLMVYCQCLTLLGCLAFLLAFHHEYVFPGKTPMQKVWLTRGVLIVLSLGFCALFAGRDWRGNVFLILGILLGLVNLVFSIAVVLDYTGRGARTGGSAPHPLMVCFWINFPLLLPALVIVVAVAGFVRDIIGVGVVGVIGAVIGLILQVRFGFARAQA
jgi:hypothetical protein